MVYCGGFANSALSEFYYSLSFITIKNCSCHFVRILKRSVLARGIRKRVKFEAFLSFIQKCRSLSERHHRRLLNFSLRLEQTLALVLTKHVFVSSSIKSAPQALLPEHPFIWPRSDGEKYFWMCQGVFICIIYIIADCRKVGAATISTFLLQILVRRITRQRVNGFL